MTILLENISPTTARNYSLSGVKYANAVGHTGRPNQNHVLIVTALEPACVKNVLRIITNGVREGITFPPRTRNARDV